MQPVIAPRKFLTAIVSLCAGLVVSGCQSTTSLEQNHARASAAVVAAEQSLIDFRHDLHRHPELSLQEKRTSGKVAEQLTELGFEVRTGIGGYGVVGILRGDGVGASHGPTIAFRADMDASRDSSADPAPYAASVNGVRHNCGHDVHSTIGIALAVGFAEIRDTLAGTVMLVFQPAEEAGTGAQAMLADGIFESAVPDAMLAIHTFPMEVGELATRPGTLLAGRARLAVTVTGTGDVVAAAARVREAIMSVSTVSQAAALQAATADFIYIELAPERVHPVQNEVALQGLVMSAGIEGRAAVKAQVMQALTSLQFEGIDLAIEYEQALEGVNNDPKIVDRVSDAMTSLVADVGLQASPPLYPVFSEDFGSFQQTIPGAMYFLGVNNSEADTIGFPHSPDYVADDGAISVGARTMLAAMLSLMEPL